MPGDLGGLPLWNLYGVVCQAVCLCFKWTNAWLCHRKGLHRADILLGILLQPLDLQMCSWERKKVSAPTPCNGFKLLGLSLFGVCSGGFLSLLSKRFIFFYKAKVQDLASPSVNCCFAYVTKTCGIHCGVLTFWDHSLLRWLHVVVSLHVVMEYIVSI